MTNSDQSLSVVLPVHNVQRALPRLVHQMLEIIPDVTSDFELLVVDDGSTDHTDEVARELAVRFPQVRVARHTERLGGEAVIKTGYQLSRGRVVIVQKENTAFGLADLRRVCELHVDQHASQGHPQRPPEPAAEPDPELVELDAATEAYLAAWSAAFRERTRRPTREELEALIADLPEAPPHNARVDERHLRPAASAAQGAGSSHVFGPPQPRFQAFRR